MVVTVPDAPASDGRRLRAERNRTAVVEAILDLILAGDMQPSAATVAERAGVSLRSVFRHFEDLDQLLLAAVARHRERTARLWAAPTPASGSQSDRVAALVHQRCRYHEETLPVRRAAEFKATTSAVLRDQLAIGTAFMRHQVGELFEPELAAVADSHGAAARRDLLDGLDVGASWETWSRLRLRQGRSADRAARVVSRILTALLTSSEVRNGQAAHP